VLLVECQPHPASRETKHPKPLICDSGCKSMTPNIGEI